MDKEVRNILKRYLKKGVSIDDLENKLIEAHCIIYKSELPTLTQEPIRLLDGTPDACYPIRILQAYRQNCDCRWAESTDDNKPTNLLLKVMNECCKKRAKLLDKAIARLGG